jgi:hypothetical protein
MGDIGQEQFTDEQLKPLGKIDIAFIQTLLIKYLILQMFTLQLL